jgi:hypothetical protein
MIRVELDIYSGLPNPTWLLSKKEENELLDQLQANPSLVRPEESAPLIGGYRGYILYVEDDRPLKRRGMSLPQCFRIGGLAQDAASELWLLGTSDPGQGASDVTKQRAEEDIRQPRLIPPALLPAPPVAPPGPALRPPRLKDRNLRRERRSTLRGERGPDASDQWWTCDDTLLFADNYYYYAWWNRLNTRRSNNCYNFSANRITNTFAQPGRVAGTPIRPPVTCSRMHDAMMADGHWIDVGCFLPGDPPGNYATAIVAVATTPYEDDFHLWRLMAPGVWAHKPGTLSATNRDFSGVAISEPFNCDRGPYTVFCGYYWGDAHWEDSPNEWERTHKVPVA